MPGHRFAIRLDGYGRGTVHLDGVLLRGVVGVNVSSEVGEMPIVELQIVAGELSVDTDQDEAN
jgi:hypothetical protein